MQNKRLGLSATYHDTWLVDGAEVPAMLIQRVCGTGFELIEQAAADHRPVGC